MAILNRLALAFAAVAAAALCLAPGNARDARLAKLTFTLDFIPSGRHAPWYAALGKGYFRDEGLDVAIIPAQGSAHAVQAVDSGKAQFGFIDVAGLALARTRGARLKLVAINYQKAPYAVFSLADGANVTRVGQLEGLVLGSGAGSFTPKIIAGLMARKGLDPGKLKIANAPPQSRADMLFSGKLPAIEFFIMAKPGLEMRARASGTRLRILLLGNAGLELYSNGIAVHETYLAKHPDVVRKFVRAALKGWRFALRNPPEAARIQAEYVKSIDTGLAAAEIGIVRDLAVTPDTQTHGLGWFDPVRMQASLDFIRNYIGLADPGPAAPDLYAQGFLPVAAIKP